MSDSARPQLQRPRHVLVAENDPQTRQRIVEAFQRWGHTVDQADTGLGVLERDCRAYDLITIDLILPEMAGQRVIERLVEIGVSTRVLVITGAYSPTLRRELEPLPNIVGWLEKPVDFQALKELVNRLFFGQRSRFDVEHPSENVFSALTRKGRRGESRLLMRSHESDAAMAAVEASGIAAREPGPRADHAGEVEIPVVPADELDRSSLGTPSEGLPRPGSTEAPTAASPPNASAEPITAETSIKVRKSRNTTSRLLPRIVPQPFATSSANLPVFDTVVRPRDGMIMLRIPDITFSLGLDDALAKAHNIEPLNGESPSVRIAMSSFVVDKYPVTNAMYRVFLEWYASATPQQRAAVDHTAPPAEADNTAPTADTDHTPSAWSELIWTKDELPVIGVSYWDASAYARWAFGADRAKDTSLLGVVGLPTEAQWEAVARGLDNRLYPWGDVAPEPTYANFNRTVDSTSPVGQFRSGRSPWGAEDIAGNVWEWCADSFDETQYTRLSRQQREHGEVLDPVCRESTGYRVLRGGSWLNGPEVLRATYRGCARPDDRFHHVGFRCAAPAPVLLRWEDQLSTPSHSLPSY